jgi:hypothetical protein
MVAYVDWNKISVSISHSSTKRWTTRVRGAVAYGSDHGHTKSRYTMSCGSFSPHLDRLLTPDRN